MYRPPPGPPRNNMNPPHFQLLMRPLTRFSADTASAIFRGLSIAAAIACVWWLARTAPEPWTWADVGAVMTWSPAALNIALNQVTWLIWPLLVYAYSAWRKDRWTAGAISYGIALSLKPFLGVFLLWMLLRRRFRPALVAVGVAAACFATGVLVYGVDVFRAWTKAVGDIVWWRSPMNASFQGFMARSLSSPYDDLAVEPSYVIPLALAGGALILVVTLWQTRARTIEESWTPLMAAALLASPLGWLYYGCWLLPGRRPFRLLFQAPMLWVPVLYLKLPNSYFVSATYHSRYFWGFALVWFVTLFGATASQLAARDTPVAFAGEG
jgi:alpha-1,2-mannosyltransferase